nr:sideroflexin-2-like [Bactrocera oleae]
MGAPGMLILPFNMQRLEKIPAYRRIRWMDCFLLFMVPTAWAIFPQNCSLKTSTIKLLQD